MARILSIMELAALVVKWKDRNPEYLGFMEATGSSATINGGGGGGFKMNQRKQRAVSRRRKMKPSAR